MRLSIGIPIHNEEEVVPRLLARLIPVVDSLPGGPHEIIFVDDGSTDRSRALLSEAARRDPRVKLVALSRNFGHQAALGAALDHARGDAVVLMDGDLQDEPEILPELLRQHQAGADVVYTRRASRREGPLLRATYKLYYRLVASLSEVPLPVDSGDFALLGAPVVAALRRLPEHQRYLRGLRTWVGFRQVGIDVQRGARAGGKPKYTIWRLIQLGLDGICSFSIVPLRAATLTGLLAIAGSGAFTVYAVYSRVVGGPVPAGFTASLVVTVFLSGVQLLFLGVIGEYIGRIYNETKRRPTYVVAEIVDGMKLSPRPE
ncbi:MAG TPA: glycosyltransferase family 2 protein [Vicinamibacterales bacterium]|jgi:glycosyltransferase involved in cell wall biosynthesis|nr:glycosyltransferase family 2 protein [Vicinamibacterales bacterium]